MSRLPQSDGIGKVALKLMWTTHALERLPERGLTHEMVERAVQDGHARREANRGPADWRIDAGHFFVLYDHPADEDIDKIRVITVWTKHRKRRRHLKMIDGGLKGYPEL